MRGVAKNFARALRARLDQHLLSSYWTRPCFWPNIPCAVVGPLYYQHGNYYNEINFRS